MESFHARLIARAAIRDISHPCRATCGGNEVFPAAAGRGFGHTHQSWNVVRNEEDSLVTFFVVIIEIIKSVYNYKCIHAGNMHTQEISRTCVRGVEAELACKYLQKQHDNLAIFVSQRDIYNYESTSQSTAGWFECCV